MTAMAVQNLILPGEAISADNVPLPSNPSVPLKIGPGLRHIPPSTIAAVLPGALHLDQRKNAIWVENTSGRYIPQLNDLVLATVHHSIADYYYCTVTSHSPLALLSQLSFENATKKTRPHLAPNTLILARIISAPKHADVEIACFNPSTGKGEGMGELKGGMVFDISLGMARRLLMGMQQDDGNVMVLQGLGERMAFEIAIGRNGKFWVTAGSIQETLVVGKAVTQTDREGLSSSQQEELVKVLLKRV